MNLVRRLGGIWKWLNSSGVLAVIAFILSLATSYYQFFQTRDSLTASIVAVDVSHDKAVGRLAVTNTGNRPGIITEARAEVFQSDPQRGTYSGEAVNGLPIVANPGEISVLEIKIQFDAEAYGHALEITDDPELRRKKVRALN